MESENKTITIIFTAEAIVVVVVSSLINVLFHCVFVTHFLSFSFYFSCNPLVHAKSVIRQSV